MKPLTKTTFHLDPELLARLKTSAAKRGSTVRELLIEGAELALEKYEGVVDRDELKRRAAKARERLRAGLFSDPRFSATESDRVLYAAEPSPKYRAR